MDTVETAFDFDAVPAPRTAGRFTLEADGETGTKDGGTVHRGKDKNGVDHIVYVPKGAGISALPSHAVAAAITGGTVPLDQLVGAYIRRGQLSELTAAITRAQKDAGAK
jgi:hypothetical protein